MRPQLRRLRAVDERGLRAIAILDRNRAHAVLEEEAPVGRRARADSACDPGVAVRGHERTAQSGCQHAAAEGGEWGTWE